MLQVQGAFQKWTARIASIAPEPTEMDPKLLGEVKLKGMNPPHYYLVDLQVENQNLGLKPGMTGLARVYGKRESILEIGWSIFADFWGRKLW